jgi:uncharacterized protein (TIGR00297 family)
VAVIVPSPLELLAVPAWGVYLYFLARHTEVAPGLDWVASVAIGLAGAALFVRLRWLDRPAAAGTFLAGTAALALGGLPWLLPILAFLVSGSLLTRLGAGEEGRRPRTLTQAAVNGIAPLLPLLGYALDGRAFWYLLYVGAVAVACADTWATEVGRLLGGAPVSLRSLRRVDKGVSGAVTLPGTLASVVGGGLVGAIAAAVGTIGHAVELVAIGVVVGPLGMAVDSVLGAWAQCRYRCVVCGAVHERPEHCGRASRPVRGVPGFTNERVNLAANAVGALLAVRIGLLGI